MKTLNKGFAQIPHGIVDAPINDTLKLLLWYFYDNDDDFTHSVSSVATRLNLTPQCVRQHFRICVEGQILVLKEILHTKQNKHAKVPIYLFKKENITNFVRFAIDYKPKKKTSKDTMDHETQDSRSDDNHETNRETNHETDRETKHTTNNTNVHNTNLDNNKIQSSPGEKDRTVSKDIIDGTKEDKKLVGLSTPVLGSTNIKSGEVNSISTPGLGSASYINTQGPAEVVSLEEQLKQFSLCQPLSVSVDEDINKASTKACRSAQDIKSMPVEVAVPLVRLDEMGKVVVPLKTGQGLGIRNIKLVELLNKKPYKLNLDSSVKEFLGHRIVAHGSVTIDDATTLGVVLITADDSQWVKQHQTWIRSLYEIAITNKTEVVLWEQDTQMLSVVGPTKERTI